MKRIRIIEANREAIEEAFEEANGKATTHTYTGGQAFLVAERAEETLADRDIPKSQRRGALAFFSGSGGSRRYGYRRTTTALSIERGPSAWELVSVERFEVPTQAIGGMTVFVTEGQAESIKARAVNAAMEGLRIHRPKAA